MQITDIGTLPAVSQLETIDRSDSKTAAREFDALLIELLLRQSGLLQSLAGEEGAEMPFLSEMFLQDFAKELAKQMDLGYGSLLVKQTGAINRE